MSDLKAKIEVLENKLKTYKDEMKKHAELAKSSSDAAQVFHGAIQSLEDCLNVLKSPADESAATQSPG